MAELLAPEWLDVPHDVNGLEPALWPTSVTRNDSGVITVAGVRATELAKQFGTPLFVLDEDDLRSRARQIAQVFSAACERIGSAASVYYAGKAFLSVDVARIVTDAGLGIDVCTGGELELALAAGVEASKLGFHGNNKSITEIDRAVSVGIGAIILDSWVEIERVAAAATAHGVVQKVRLRVNSGVHAHTHDFLATAHEDQKFGFPLEAAAAAAEAVRSHSSLEFLGLHCHIGSQIFDAGGFVESASRLLAVHAGLLRDGDVPELNLGGGFGIRYTASDTPNPLEESLGAITEAIARECTRYGIAVPRLAFEPGRAVIGPSMFTLYEVGTVKDVQVSRPSGDDATRLYVSVDGGMSDNIRPALYGAHYSVRCASRVSSAPPCLVRVVGKHCETGDVVVDADYLPADIQPGDLVAIPATGAYCWVLASNYNYVGRPPVVSVRNGSAHLMIRGETTADLFSRDTGVALDNSSRRRDPLQ